MNFFNDKGKIILII